MATLKYIVDLSWAGPGSPGQNVWYVRTAQDLTSSDRDAAALAINDFYGDIVDAGILSGDNVITGRSEMVDEATSEILPVDGWTLDSASGPQLYAAVAQMIVTMRTSSATRSGRGRKFIGPVRSTTMEDDGTPTAGAIGTLQTACDTLLASSLAETGWAVGVYSREQNLFRDATALQVRNYFAVLRSRRD